MALVNEDGKYVVIKRIFSPPQEVNVESHAWMTSHSKRKVYLHTTLLYTSMYYIQYAMLLCKLTPSQVARKMSSEIFDFVT